MLIVQDNIMAPKALQDVRQSALDAGFGNWTPKSSLFGSGTYGGMGWKGHHGAMHVAVTRAIQRAIFPNSSFFRVLLANEEKRLIHSDQLDGNYTAIIYLSEHDEKSGTGFYRHKETGLEHSPTVQEMIKNHTTDYWRKESVDEDAWEQTDYIEGKLGRCLIFSASLFHGRVPPNGIGDTPSNGRMIWVSHFFTQEDLTPQE